MIIYPAIDCREGKCVRLYQGDYQQQTIYSDSPIDTANAFADQGAEWLHVVDLDGAKNPEKNQSDLMKNLIQQSSLSIQIGGGVRSKQQIEYYLNAGAKRVIIGSLAVQQPDLVSNWLQQYGSEKIVLALDVLLDENQQARVAYNAWQSINPMSLDELIQQYRNVGLKHVLCTDIAKDGTMKGPNIQLYVSLKKQFPLLQIQASGGIHSLADLQQLRLENINGAITGRALYENKFTLQEALQC